MADLVITLPRTVRWPDYERELAAVRDGSRVMNFRVPSRPKMAGPGDRCYLVYNGTVQGYMSITAVVFRDGFECDTTGAPWPAGWYVQRSGPWTPINTMISMKGFQGWRYAPPSWRALQP